MRALILAGGAMVAAVIVVCAQAPASDPLMQALRDEVQRSASLKLAGLDTPYFVQYTVDEADSFTVTATLGGVLSRSRNQFRSPDLDVRVGDYKFDNTNFGGGGGGGSRYDLGAFPMEDAYSVMRRYLWLMTDSAYKGAVESISRKRAAMRNVNQNEQLSDFAHAEPVKLSVPFTKLTFDEKAWVTRVKALSALFVRYPGVKTSSVEFHADNGGYYVVNSEGTEVKVPENVTFLRVRATSQAPDGTTLHDSVVFHSLDIAHLPSEEAMTREVNKMAENLIALARAPKGEDYNGPILFEGMAGPQVLAEVLSKNLTLTRQAVGGRGGGTQAGEYEGRMGARVLPDTFEVVDDPTQKEWRGKPLFGSYEADREGVVPKPLHLIEKGALKGYLLTRQPVRGFEGSNGRARLPGGQANVADISNLFVSSSDTMPAGDMKKKLLELIETRSKPYGIIVRKMDFPSTAPLDEVRKLLTAAQGGRPVSMPTLVYKVYPDGREELVRGLRFRGFNARSLKDILAAGDDSMPFDFMDSTAPFALVGQSSYTTEATLIAPSILIDDLELHPADDELPKLPVVAPPTLVK